MIPDKEKIVRGLLAHADAMNEACDQAFHAGLRVKIDVAEAHQIGKTSPRTFVTVEVLEPIGTSRFIGPK